LTFSFVSLAVLVLNNFTDGLLTPLLFSVHRAPLSDLLFYPRMVTHVLGHVDLNHFIGNFVIILLVGPMLEEKYGAKWLAVMMAVTAFITGVTFLIFGDPATMMLGASGVVYMLMLLGSFANLHRGRIPLTLLLALAVFVGREIIAGYSDTGSNVSHTSHIVGGVCGALFGFFMNREKIIKD
jgi:membrane associated rhomboid family serine protease